MDYATHLSDNNVLATMLAAANRRISDLIKENNKLKLELETWKKRYQDCEYRKHFEETTDYER